MKKLGIAIVCALVLTGCAKEFAPNLEKAKKSFAEKNYIDTIDALNVGLPNWRKEDGNDKKAEAYQLLGKSYHQLHTIDKAISSYSEAIKLSDNVFDSAYALGNLSLAKSQPENAVGYFTQALRMKPNDPQALLGMGNGLYEQKKYSDAAIAYEKVLDSSPGVREALEALSLIRGRARPVHGESPSKKPVHHSKRSK